MAESADEVGLEADSVKKKSGILKLGLAQRFSGSQRIYVKPRQQFLIYLCLLEQGPGCYILLRLVMSQPALVEVSVGDRLSLLGRLLSFRNLFI